MKESRNERLSDALAGTDDRLLAKAWDTDSPEKLRTYRKQVRAARRRKRLARACAAAAAAILLVTVGVRMQKRGWILPGGQTTATGDGSRLPDSDGLLPPPESGVVIDSMDKVNYYGAKRMLESGGHRAQALADTRRETAADGSEDTPDGDPGDMGVRDVVGSEDLSGYTFTIKTAIRFAVTVAEDDPFLTEKLGAGVAEVVLTDLNFGINSLTVMTFRHGDRFFSCTTESYSLEDGENLFGTHLYVKGFCFYKDLTQGVRLFRVTYDRENEQITAMKWSPYNRIQSQAPVYTVQINEGGTQVIHGSYSFTVDDLKRYYGGQTGTEPADSDSTQTSGGTDPLTPDEKGALKVRSGANHITVPGYLIRREAPDENGEWYEQVSAVGGAYERLLAGNAEMPVLTYDGALTFLLPAHASVESVRVYERTAGGEYVQESATDRPDGEFSVAPGGGTRYVIVSVRWNDRYVEADERYAYRSIEYLFCIRPAE